MLKAIDENSQRRGESVHFNPQSLFDRRLASCSRLFARLALGITFLAHRIRIADRAIQDIVNLLAAA
jgi:hypothetical protein